MTTKIIHRGRTLWTNEPWGKKKLRPPVVEEMYTLPVTYDPPKPPAIGGTYFDENEDLRYRIVGPLDPFQGWCIMDALINHYQLPTKVILRWCQMGMIDAVIEHRSAVRRYFVRNPHEVEQRAKVLRAKIRAKSKDTLNLRRLMRSTGMLRTI